MNNKVIIIGDDHTNTLGVIRTFGENGIKPYVIIISKTKMVAVVKSKYVEKYWICTDENIALLTMMSEFSNEKEKPVVIPTSDSITLKMDESYNRLSEKFIVQNINNKQGQITKYMDKFNQYQLVKENNINMANSSIIDLNSSKENIINFPCILKPIISANGKKEDITICNNKNDYLNAIENLKRLNYSKILVQDFIDYKYEMDISGFSFDGEVCIPGGIEKIRIWPEKKGSTTYGLVVPPKKIDYIIKDISKIMKTLNYNGIFDIDIFVNNENYYLNEINFRNGALSYAYGNSYICYYWYLSNVNEKLFECPNIDKEYTFMSDQSDFHNVIDKKLKYRKYCDDKKNSKILLEKNSLDYKVAKKMRNNKILNKIKMNKFLDISYKILHKDIKGYLLSVPYNKIDFNHYNNDYKIEKITIDNYKKVCENESDIKEVLNLIKSKKIHGLFFTKDDKIICRGYIKQKGANDSFFSIKNDNSFVISHIHVYEEFREKNYQCDLILELIKKYANDKQNNFYAFIYDYNIPSIKNFEKIGFKKYNEIEIIRLCKKSINKEVI